MEYIQNFLKTVKSCKTSSKAQKVSDFVNKKMYMKRTIQNFSSFRNKFSKETYKIENFFGKKSKNQKNIFLKIKIKSLITYKNVSNIAKTLKIIKLKNDAKSTVTKFP